LAGWIQDQFEREGNRRCASKKGLSTNLQGATPRYVTANLSGNADDYGVSPVKIVFRLLPYIYLILTALVLLSMVSVLMGINALLQEGAQQAPNPRQIVPLIVLLLIALGLGTVYAFNAVFLLRKVNRKASLILSIISCIGFPLGTIVGILSLIVLTRREIKDEYA
jgi:hypothetical protein